VSSATILILEDDLSLRSVLVRGLREEGFTAESVGSGAHFLERLDTVTPDALIIDIGLPDADGRDVCQAVRARGIRAPVLFLTARTQLHDRLAGFNAGGDDYLGKPFDFKELVARLEALVRRSGGQPAVAVGRLELDPAAHALRAGEQTVPLTPTEFRLLARLAAAPGGAVRRRALVLAAWPAGAIVHDNTLDAYIARLRRKLAALPDAPCITTIHGVGYSLSVNAQP
jgi:two-component system, OmpR family, response regulator